MTKKQYSNKSNKNKLKMISEWSGKPVKEIEDKLKERSLSSGYTEQQHLDSLYESVHKRMEYKTAKGLK